MNTSSSIGFRQAWFDPDATIATIATKIKSNKFSPHLSKLKPSLASFLFKSLCLFAVILLVFSLSACGGGGGGAPADPGDITAPNAPVITSPADGTQIFNRSPTVTGTAESGSTIALFDTNGTTSLGSSTTNAAGNWNLTSSSLGTGAHSLMAKATDATGNTSAASTSVSITVHTIPTMGSLYPANGANWNDYVKTSDPTTACEAAIDGPGYSACIHGGEKRVVEVSGYSSCTGLSATDALGALDWSCDGSTNPVRMVSTGLRDITAVSGATDDTSPDQLVNSTASFVTDGVEAGDTVINTTNYTTTTVVSIDSETQLTLADDIFVAGESYSINKDKNLSDLLNFTTPGWLDNSVTVLDGTTTLFATATSTWWSNPVIENNDGGSLSTSGTVYLVTIDPNADYTLDASKIALVVKPGVTLTGSGGGNNNIAADTQNFLWLEGTIDATSNNRGVYLDSVKFSVIRNLSASNATNSGVRLDFSSNNNSLSNVTTPNNNFGIQISFSSNNNSLSNITAANNRNRGVLLYSFSNNNTLLNIAASNSNIGIYIDYYSNNNSLSNVTATSNDTAGVWLDRSSNNNSLSDIIATNSIDGDGVYLQGSSNNSLSNITVTNNFREGVFLSNSSNNNTLSNITAANNTGNGVYLSSSTDNSLSDVTTAENNQGVYLNDSSNNSFSNITTTNNETAGIYLSNSSSNNSLSNITTSNNWLYGILLQGVSNNNSLSDISAVNNYIGVYLHNSSSYNSLSNISTANNNSDGILIQNTSSNNSLSNIASAHNGGSGVSIENGSLGNYFTGLLKVGSNTSDCFDSVGDTFSDTNCAVMSPSDFALTQSITLTSSFVGKIADDIANTTPHPNGVIAYASITDWLNFENAYRGWGREDANDFPHTNHRRQCTSGDCRIWDWSADFDDTVIRDVLADPDDVDPIPDGDDTITHEWSDTTTVTYLRNAVEIMGDGDGNENSLCETNEACLFTPNIGSYQGHGALQSAGTFTDGTISGVTLMEYDTNGY